MNPVPYCSGRSTTTTTTTDNTNTDSIRRFWQVTVILEHRKHTKPVRIRHAGLCFHYDDFEPNIFTAATHATHTTNIHAINTITTTASPSFPSPPASDVYYFEAVRPNEKHEPETDTPTAFTAQWLRGFDPFRHHVVASHASLGPMVYGISGPDLVDLLRGVVIPDPSSSSVSAVTTATPPPYHCQTWVQAALTKLYQRAFLSYSQYSTGFMALETPVLAEEKKKQAQKPKQPKPKQRKIEPKKPLKK